MDFDHLQKFTKKMCAMTLEDILKKPETSSQDKPSFFEDGDFKNDDMDEFEEVVCEELVENCLEQMRKHSARYSELDIITEQSCESGETTMRNDNTVTNNNNNNEGAPPSLLI